MLWLRDNLNKAYLEDFKKTSSTVIPGWQSRSEPLSGEESLKLQNLINSHVRFFLFQVSLQTKEKQAFNLSVKTTDVFSDLYSAIRDHTLSELRTFSKEMGQFSTENATTWNQVFDLLHWVAK